MLAPAYRISQASRINVIAKFSNEQDYRVMDADLKAYLDSKFGGLETKFDARFAVIDENFSAIDAKFAAIDKKFAAIDVKFEDLENRLIERMRDMQTELLRGFESFSAGQTIRLRKLEADQSNLDVSLRGRVDVLETRLTQIELRLGAGM